MNLSGIVVFVPPARVADGVAALNALEGVEVHHAQTESGKIVVVQEAASVHDEIDGLKRIKALPDVIAAELVYHYFAEDPSMARDPVAELSALDGMELEPVPEALRNNPGDDLLDVSS
jgi:nitrate reductase NapD